METKRKTFFIEGEITAAFIAESIAKHSTKKEIGAHSIFLGQVRNDDIGGKKVIAIDYSCYEEMADEVLHEIREAAFSKFQLTCMHVFHSTGKVEAGKISLFVFTSSPHRKNAIDACSWVVDEIKTRVPIWGKELLENESFVWKNT